MKSRPLRLPEIAQRWPRWRSRAAGRTGRPCRSLPPAWQENSPVDPAGRFMAGWPGPRRQSPAQNRRATARWGWSRSLRRRRRPADQPAGFRSAGWWCIPMPAAVEWQERSSTMPCNMRGRAERRQSSPTRGPTGPPPSPSGKRWKEKGNEKADSHHLSDGPGRQAGVTSTGARGPPVVTASRRRHAPVSVQGAA